MRRKDKEITDRKIIDEILEKAEVVRVAMVDEGEPYLVALNYAYAEGALYIHSAKEGRKLDVLKKNNKVAFQTDIDVGIVLNEQTDRCTTRYMSVYGTGRAFLLDGRDDKIKALDAIMTKHTSQPGHTSQTGFVYPENVLNMTLIIKIEIDSLTGKKSGYQN